jgi:5-methylcytosine-specific restriction endonuclease McrA
MSMPKSGRLRHDPAAFDELKLEILNRDGWRCQRCSKRDQLQIHHMVRRSQSGENCEENLIVPCNDCHRALHLTRAARRKR